MVDRERCALRVSAGRREDGGAFKHALLSSIKSVSMWLTGAGGLQVPHGLPDLRAAGPSVFGMGGCVRTQARARWVARLPLRVE